jgi:hypothetical protein
MAPQKKGEEEHVALDLHNLEDDYFDPQTPISRVLSKARSGPFSPGSLSLLSPIPLQVELERTFGGACYIGLHFVPAAVGLAALNGLSFALPGSLLTCTNSIFAGFSAYMLSLYAAWRLVSLQQGKHLSKCNPDQITMRNNEKFYSMKAVWNKGAGPEEMRDCPAIYCMVPHGEAENLYPKSPKPCTMRAVRHQLQNLNPRRPMCARETPTLDPTPQAPTPHLPQFAAILELQKEHQNKTP